MVAEIMGCGVFAYLTRVYREPAYIFFNSMNIEHKLECEPALESPMSDSSEYPIKGLLDTSEPRVLVAERMQVSMYLRIL